MITLTREEAQSVLDALGKVTKQMLSARDELGERGGRPVTNTHHQEIWDKAFEAYTDHAIPAAEFLRARLSAPEPDYRDVVIKGDLWRIEFLPDHAASVVLVRANYVAQPEPAPTNNGRYLTGYKAQPEPEPVAWIKKDRSSIEVSIMSAEYMKNAGFEPLYTAPPQREWQGLTDEEIREGNRESWVTTQAWQSAVWWAEERLKEKNT